MLLSMGIGLYSVRIVLEALGDIDFGVYNVVAGIVTMLAFLNNALSSTTQRYLSFEEGKGNTNRLKEIFSNSILIYLIFCIVIIILSETVGLWIVNKYLVIPPEKVFAANVIYQFSILSFIFSILVTPYNAIVIARERMGVFAYISIAESVVKLGMVFLLLCISSNKLILYGFMMMLINFMVLAVYHIYCRRKFSECQLSISLNKGLAKELSGYAGWSVWGAFSNIFSNQGVNIILNRFFGVIVNAARGIAYQVNGALNTCVQNFLLAVKPQLIKSYAASDYTRMNELLILSTRVSFYLMFIITLIFVNNISSILAIWLGSYPEYTSKFVCLVLISTLINILAQPVVMLIMASAKIKRYQILSGVNNILVLPLSYIFLRIYENPYIPFYILIGTSVTYFVISILCCNKIVKLPARIYFGSIFKIIIVCVLTYLVLHILPTYSGNIYRGLAVSILLTIIICSIFILSLDMSNAERKNAKEYLIGKLRRNHKK